MIGEVLTIRQSDKWIRVLDRCSPYDFYHLPQYHSLAEENGEGLAHLFVYTEGDYAIALPLLLRPLAGLPFAGHLGSSFHDATSVYGYAGPLSSHQQIPDTVARNFRVFLRGCLRDMQVVAVFSRLHPFFPQRAVLSGLGEFQTSQTVSIDLTLPDAEQCAKYRRNHRVAIDKLRRLGLTCFHDRDGSYLKDFVRIYYETMDRVNAAKRWFFPVPYFGRFWQALDSRAHLFLCSQQGHPICGALLVSCHGILQLHLAGTANNALKLAPMKLLLDEARRWGTGQGLKVLHLGGGAKPDPDDSLLFFKRGFSDRVHDFSVWRWILFPDVYRQLCADNSQWNEWHKLRAETPNYFPEYRCPAVPCISRAADLAAAESPEPERFSPKEQHNEHLAGLR